MALAALEARRPGGAAELGLSAVAPAGVRRRLARVLEGISVRARRSDRFARTLTAAYRAELEDRAAAGAAARVVSSHDLALTHRPSGWPGTLVGPDVLPQPTVATIPRPRVALSPCPSYSDGLLRAGYRADEILETGPLVDEVLLEARAARLERRARVARGEVEPGALFALGGSAPERGAVTELVRRLAGDGVRVRALVGDGRAHARGLRTCLEGQPRVEVLGGRPGDDRAGELERFHELLADPSCVAWITRPNEGAPLALALGFELWLLPPYQPHERAAWDVLARGGVPDAAELFRGRRVGDRPEPADDSLVCDPCRGRDDPALPRALALPEAAGRA
jgi:hypothetical protein